MNILYIKLYVRTDVKWSTEEILFLDNQKESKLFRSTSSYKTRYLSVYWLHAPSENRIADSHVADPHGGTMMPYTVSGMISVLYSVSDKIFGSWEVLHQEEKKMAGNFSQWHEVEQDSITMSIHVLEKSDCRKLRRN